jgi:hypothetical protein
MSRIVYDDIKALKSQGLSGIIEDGSQRSYFPTGFQFHVYGETLYDATVEYEDLVCDYFSHAYGKNWTLVRDYLCALKDAVPYAYYFGILSKDIEKGKYYNPDILDGARRMKKIIEDFRPVIEENLDQEQRASAVAWQILKLHSISAYKFAEMTEYKCVGNDDKADEIIIEAAKEMSKKEKYYETYYDHFLYFRTLKIFMKNKDLLDNIPVSYY